MGTVRAALHAGSAPSRHIKTKSRGAGPVAADAVASRRGATVAMALFARLCRTIKISSPVTTLLAVSLSGSRSKQPLSLMNAGFRRIGANGRLIGSVFCGGFFIVIWIDATASRPWAAETGRADARYLFSVARRIATLGFVHLAAVRAKVRCNHVRRR